MRKTVGFGIALLAFGFVALAEESARGHKWVKKSPNAGKVKAASKLKKLDQPLTGAKTRAVNFIQYDTGVVNAVGNQFSFVYGNRFNSNSGVPIPATAQITQAQWYLANLSGTGGWVSFYGPPNGTTAPVITALNAFSLSTGLNTIAALVSPGSDFLAGGLNFYSASNTIGNAVGADVGGTLNGQGFHGMLIHSTFTPTGYAPLPSANVVFRVYGTNVPVELMGFEVTD